MKKSSKPSQEKAKIDFNSLGVSRYDEHSD
jgi:hypothetical protein